MRQRTAILLALGTHFAWLDILAYLVGVVIAFQIDERSFTIHN